MPLVALLLALQAAQDPPEFEPATKQSHFQIGPIFQYWFPRFNGDLRMDGSTRGTTLNLVDDLNLPDEAAIPMYGGGRIGGRIYGKSEWINFAGVAEYWTHAWKGREVLTSDATLGDHTFLAGTSVDSRFTMSAVTLDIEYTAITKDVTYGAYLSFQVLSARMRMDSAAVDGTERIDDICWGGGIFVDVRPVSFLLVGLSLKGFTNFGEAGDTGEGDFRFYGGAQWGPFRVEGGFRIILYHHRTEEELLNFTMYGGYAQASVILRF